MAYLSNFPKRAHDLNKDGNIKVVTDILRRVAVRQNIKTNASLYDDYQMNGLDRPEIMANKIYGDPELYWIIMMMNDVIDPFYDFTLDDQSMEAYLEMKYPGRAFFLDDGLTDEATNIEVFEIGDTMFPKGATLVNSTQGEAENYATVYRFNRTYQRLEVIDVTGSFSIGDVVLAKVDGVTKTTATIGRIMSRNTDALHHFRDPDTYNTLSPLPTSTSGPNSTPNLKTYIQRFKTSVNPETPLESSSVLTNRDHESYIDESLRSIKILSPEYVSMVKREFEELINQ